MQSILFALFTYIGWGVGDIPGAISSRKIGSYSFTFWAILLRAIIFALYIPFAISEFSKITFEIFLTCIVLGFAWMTGMLSLFHGYRVGNPAVVATITSSFTALVVILSLIFLQEKLTVAQGLIILIIFIGIFLTSFPLKEFKKVLYIYYGGLQFAFIAMLSFAIYFTFIKLPIREIGWFWPTYISFLTFPILYLFMKFKKKALVGINYKGGAWAVLSAGLLTGLGDFSFNIAVDKGLTAIVAPIAGSSVTLFVLLTFLFFKDPITKQQILGIITTLIGIVLLSFFSV